MNILTGIFEQGFTYAYLAVGLYLAYKILDFPDLTVDGSFTLGAAVTAVLITNGFNPFISLFFSLICGAIAGFLTGVIHVKLGIKDLLSGLIMQTALYTINLSIAGQSNLPFYSENTIFQNNLTAYLPKYLLQYKTLLAIIPIIFLVKFILDWFLNTKSGFLLKASGDNPTLVKTFGKNPGDVKIMGLSISNALVAFSGSLVAQEQRFFEISMGTGAMVMGLASLIIGLKLFKNFNLNKTTKVIFGSIIYKASIALAIQIGFSANSLKLMTAIIFLGILVSSDKKTKRRNYVKS